MLRPVLIRSLHTTSARPAGGFGRFNPWAKQSTVPPTSTESTTEQSKPDTAFSVNHYEEEEESLLWRDRNVNQSVDEIPKTVQTIVTDNVSGVTESNWKNVRFDSVDTKLKVIKESIKQTGKEVSNRELSNIQTGADLLAYFTNTQEPSALSKPSSVRSYFEANADTLPSNLTFRH